MGRAARWWAVVGTLACGPSVGDGGDGGSDATSEAAPTDTGPGPGASGPDPSTGHATASVGDDDPQPKLDLPPGDPDPEPSPCGPLDELGPTECYPSGVANPTSPNTWVLAADEGPDCALVCMSSECITDACFFIVHEIRVVHDGVRIVAVEPDTEIVERMDGATVILQPEGWTDRARVAVAHALDGDAYTVSAADQTTGEPLWGPVAMHPYAP